VLRHEEPGFEHVALALLPTAVAGAWALFSRRGPLATERGAMVVMSCALIGTYATALACFAPEVGRLTSDRDLAAAAIASGPPPDAVVVHRIRPFSFLFYSGWPAVYKVTDDEYRTALMRPGRVLVLTKDSRLDSLPATDPPVPLREIARNHRHVLYERLPF
jgi:hypothetical protein